MNNLNLNNYGEFEALILYEAHCYLAEMIHVDFYEVHGTKPHQRAVFHNTLVYDLFIIKMVELISPSSITISGERKNFSIMDGMGWLCFKQYPKLRTLNKLRTSYTVFNKWLNEEIEISFWCALLKRKLTIKVERNKIINWSANITKHTPFRLGLVLERMSKIYKKNNIHLNELEVLATKDDLYQKIRDDVLAYHESYIVEMLGNVFYGLNLYVKYRSKQRKKIYLPIGLIAHNVKYPKSLKNDFYKELYSTTLAFKCYDDERILSYIPSTTKYLKMRY